MLPAGVGAVNTSRARVVWPAVPAPDAAVRGRDRPTAHHLHKYEVDEDDGFIQRARRRRFVERLDSFLADGFFFRLDRR